MLQSNGGSASLTMRSLQRNLMHSGTLSQCSSQSSGKICSVFLAEKTSRAAAFRTDCSRCSRVSGALVHFILLKNSCQIQHNAYVRIILSDFVRFWCIFCMVSFYPYQVPSLTSKHCLTNRLPGSTSEAGRNIVSGGSTGSRRTVSTFHPQISGRMPRPLSPKNNAVAVTVCPRGVVG